MSIRVAIDLKIFHILAKEDVAIASADLASRCKAEELLISMPSTSTKRSQS